MVAVLLAEFFGTIPYMLAWNMNDGNNSPALVLFTMICITGPISGGHLNPALTLSVYIERNQYGRYACLAISMAVAQILGCLAALAIGFMLRVQIPIVEQPGEVYFVPGQYPFYPGIIDKVEGLPAYGQVFLAEMAGATLFLFFVMVAKFEIEKGVDYWMPCVGVAVALVFTSRIFNDVSGGLYNPAVALALICW